MKTIATLLCLGAASAAAHAYVTLDYSTQLNMSRNDSLLANGGTFPYGNQTFLGVPFAMGGGPDVNTPWAWNAYIAQPGSGTSTLTVPVNIFGITTAYSLISTYWGQPGPASYAAVTFTASGGLTQTFALTGNSDIRDYNQNIYTNTINGTTTREVFNNNIGQRLDMQQFDLAPAFATRTLLSVTITDTGDTNFQRVFMSGLTVNSVPGPGGLAMVGVGVGLVGRRRR